MIRRLRALHGPSGLEALALPALLLVAACAPSEPGVHAEPRALVFSAAAERLELQLVNSSPTVVPLSRIRFDPRAPDWGSFVLEDREYPREIAAGGLVSLRLRVDREHFARGGAEVAGHGRLLFVAGEAAHAVELRYAPADPAADLRAALLRSALLLVLVGVAALLLRREKPGTIPWTSWLPALVVFALLPLGPGLCGEGLTQPLSTADVAQCAAGHGGGPFSLVAVGEGWLVYLVALVLAALGRLTQPTALAWKSASRDLALALAFAGPLLAFGTLDPATLVGDQAVGLLASSAISPRWGLFVQPIAAAVALAVAAAPPRVRLERIAFAAAFTACFLGGATIPGAPFATTSHATSLIVGVAVFAAKFAAIAWLVQRLHAASPGSPARAALLLLVRAGIPVALASLLITSAWAQIRG